MLRLGSARVSAEVALAVRLSDERGALAIRAARLRRAESAALAAGDLQRADRCAKARELVSRARNTLDYERNIGG